MLEPIPLALLTGFLGAGKTTRLNLWLKDPAFKETLVILNEYGAVGLDHLLVEAAPGEVVLLAAGCLCCSVRGDLAAALEDILRRRDNGRIAPFTNIILETTGLADPLPVLHTVLQHPYFSKRFAISAIISVVDAVLGATTLANHVEARRQVALADALILSKTDIADKAARAASVVAIRALNPGAPLLEAPRPEDLLLPRFDPSRLEGDALEGWITTSATPTHQGAGIEAFGFTSADLISEGQLLVFREAMRVLHGPKLLRMKGLIGLKESPEHPVVIHGVQSVQHAPVQLECWPSRDRRSRLAFITDGVPRATIEGFWNALVKG